jgi:hypothetical protein
MKIGMRSWQGRPRSGYLLLGAPFLFVLLHFLIWPAVWRGIILPQHQPEKSGFRVETYRYDIQFKVQEHIRTVPGPLFTLDQPLTFLSAYALWQVSQKGAYRIRISGEGRDAALFIDNRPVVNLWDLNSRSVAETQQWLSPGPHLLEVRLRNRCQPGWLLLEADGSGQLDPKSLEDFEPRWAYPEQYGTIAPQQLSVLELGNIDTWLAVVAWGEYLSWLAVFLAGGLGLRRLYARYWAGRIFPSRRWKVLWLFLAFFTLVLSGVYHVEHPIPPIWSDGLGYYSYLPSYLIYHDLSQESLYEPSRRYGYPSRGLDFDPGEGFIRHAVTGRYLIKYPLGTAVLEFPFFLAAHLLAPFLGAVSDGFSLPYQVAVVAAATTYMLLGLIFLLKVLSDYFPPRVVLATLLSLFLGTSLLAYGAIELSLSHVYSFFLISLLLLLIPRWTADSSWKNSFFLGLLGGLIPLVRNTNVLCLLILPLYGVTDWDSLKGKARFLWERKFQLVFLAAVSALVFSPQILVWKVTTGHFLVSTYTYPFERFYFLSPSIYKVLFSPHHGLFVWAPILIFSVPGFFLMKGPLRSFRLSLAVCLLLQLYVVSSWYLWYFGWSFGHRGFVDVLGLFALPLACYYDGVRRPWARRTLSAVGTLMIALTLYWFVQYFQGVLPGEMRPYMTWKIYKQMLLDPRGVVDLWQWIKKPEVRNQKLIL